MGLMGLPTWLETRNTEWKKDGKKDEAKPHEHVYFDMGHVLHKCFKKDLNLTRTAYLERVTDFITNELIHLKPTKLLVIAFDGVAPAAKLLCQRERRTQKDKWLDEDGDEDGNHYVQKEQLTPGTSLMHFLSKAMWEFVGAYISSHKIMGILSDSNVLGEAEMKIVKYICNTRNIASYNIDDSHAICTGDSDMLLLTLLAHELHISMHQRIRVPGGTEAHVLNLRHIREIVAHVAGFNYEDLGSPLSSRHFEIFLEDFVFLSIFHRTDFLPCLSFLSTFEHLFDILIGVYRTMLADGKHLIESGKIKYENVIQFLERLGEREMELVQLNRLEDSLDTFKEKYYGVYYPQRDAIARKYIEGLCWHWQYMSSGKSCWEWCYGFKIAPLIDDLRKFKHHWGYFSVGSPPSPLCHFVMTQPLRSKNSPQGFQNLLDEPFSSLEEDYENLTEGTSHNYNLYDDKAKGDGNTPDLNSKFSLFKKACEQMTLTEKEKKKNYLGKDVIFVYEESKDAGQKYIEPYCGPLHEGDVNQDILKKLVYATFCPPETSRVITDSLFEYLGQFRPTQRAFGTDCYTKPRPVADPNYKYSDKAYKHVSAECSLLSIVAHGSIEMEFTKYVHVKIDTVVNGKACVPGNDIKNPANQVTVASKSGETVKWFRDFVFNRQANSGRCDLATVVASGRSYSDDTTEAVVQITFVNPSGGELGLQAGSLIRWPLQHVLWKGRRGQN